MLCEKCNQNYATTVITKTINGQTSTINLCAVCAFKTSYSNLFNNLTLNNILPNDLYENEDYQQSKQCGNCGCSFAQIIENGVLGCSECYKSFETELLQTIENIHGKAIHIGKRPSRQLKNNPNINTIEHLREQIKIAIESEDFETAAVLRDEIKKSTIINKTKNN